MSSSSLHGFVPIAPRSINHEKYTLVIFDEYLRHTWVYILKKKSHAPETIMSFIKRVENHNDINVKQFRTDNDIVFRNNILVNFCDEKMISQNFSSPYTHEQNDVAKRKNRNLIEVVRTMLSGSVFSKLYWTEVVATACYTQNRVFNTRRQQTEETFYITFNENTEAIKFSKPSVDEITIAKSERYPHDDYLHHFELSQWYQVDRNVVQLIEPYERPEPIVTEAGASFDQKIKLIKMI
ncbi:retrovirus-related pol polyprotein from transposon TNT 1-94 [Tanacetum coccineum]